MELPHGRDRILLGTYFAGAPCHLFAHDAATKLQTFESLPYCFNNESPNV